MEQKFLARERNRKNHVKEVINKQRERENKARKVREKSCVELEGSIIHVDDTYSSGGDSQRIVCFCTFSVHTVNLHNKTSYLYVNTKFRIYYFWQSSVDIAFKLLIQPHHQAL